MELVFGGAWFRPQSDLAATPVPEPAAWVGALLGPGLVARSHGRRLFPWPA